ncbi:hypothetical protein [Pseudoxanthomonas sp. SGT-18]|uniref:hypothetical protein n=1 Tax=Pseudoxanthomonas sp. SGT-18 TaxID=2493087 RepID=UPI000F629C52|nr:hypothetical protein [Pseudoxanthomonas sp. SGT-18]
MWSARAGGGDVAAATRAMRRPALRCASNAAQGSRSSAQIGLCDAKRIGCGGKKIRLMHAARDAGAALSRGAPGACPEACAQARLAKNHLFFRIGLQGARCARAPCRTGGWSPEAGCRLAPRAMAGENARAGVDSKKNRD